MEKLSEDTIERILELRMQGRSEREIAAEVGCSRSAVWYQIQKDRNLTLA